MSDGVDVKAEKRWIRRESAVLYGKRKKEEHKEKRGKRKEKKDERRAGRGWGREDVAASSKEVHVPDCLPHDKDMTLALRLYLTLQRLLISDKSQEGGMATFYC